jgi:hypothetical protein
MVAAHASTHLPSRGLPALLAALLLAACSSQPSDPDGAAGVASPLPLGVSRTDGLDCGRDCSDWYVVTVSAEGRLAARAAARGLDQGRASLRVELYDAELRVLDRTRGGNLEVVGVEHAVSPGRYYLVVSQRPSDPPLAYRLEARLVRLEPIPPAPPPAEASPREPATPKAPQPDPAPPEPAGATLSARILEIEGRPEQRRSVLIDQGSRAGLRPGLRGTLVDHGRTLGHIEVTDVYADGSRARLLGRLEGTIGPETRARIRLSGE